MCATLASRDTSKLTRSTSLDQMADAKGDELVAKAEKKLKGFQLFGNKHEEALEMFEKAVNSYKLSKRCENWLRPPFVDVTARWTSAQRALTSHHERGHVADAWMAVGLSARHFVMLVPVPRKDLLAQHADLPTSIRAPPTAFSLSADQRVGGRAVCRERGRADIPQDR